MARNNPDRQHPPINVVHKAKRTFLQVRLKHNGIEVSNTVLPAEGENGQAASKPPINVVHCPKSRVIHKFSVWPTPIGVGHSLEA
jgi:hypothetical protein